MNVLVTGGTGFVGSPPLSQLSRSGDTVRALVRPGGNRRLITSLGAEPVTGDLDDQDSLPAACGGCEIFYHSAARVEIVGQEEDFHRTTVAGTARMVAAAKEKKVRRFVQVSSC